MKKAQFLLFLFVLILDFSFGQDTTEAASTVITESSNTEEPAPGILFWISCFIAGALPWVFIYLMKQRNQRKK